MSPKVGVFGRRETAQILWNSAKSRRIIAEWTDTPTPGRRTPLEAGHLWLYGFGRNRQSQPAQVAACF